MKYTAILFDLEGTIIDTEKVWDEVDVEFLGRRGVTHRPDDTKHLIMGGSWQNAITTHKQIHGIQGDNDALADERRQIFADLLEHDIEFIPGFQEFHNRIKSTYKHAIATSMARTFLPRVEQHLHLSQYFGEHIYSIADIGNIAKPNPDIFLYAAKKLGVEPGKCLVIEDAPNGVQAAKTAGMDCVALTTSTTRERLEAAGADQIVDEYAQIQLPE